jgi:hypothetical protein
MKNIYKIFVFLPFIFGLKCSNKEEVKPKTDEYFTVTFRGKQFNLKVYGDVGSYLGFNDPYSEPYIVFHGNSDLVDVTFSFQENIKTKVNEFSKSFTNKQFAPNEVGLGVNLIDYSNKLDEIYYHDKFFLSDLVTIAIHEFKDNGLIKGKIKCKVIGYSNSISNKVEDLTIDFALRYDIKK